MRPFAARHFGHGAEQSFFRALAQQHAPVGAQRHEGRAAAQFAFALWRLARKFLLTPPSACATQTSLHGHSAQAGRLGEQMVAPRSISACAKSPARLGGNNAAASRLMIGLAAGNFLLDGKQPRHHALDIAVHRHRRGIERDRRHRRRGVVADAGQRPQRLKIGSGKIPPWRSTTARAQACRLRARA